MNNEFNHQPVMLKESLEALRISADGVYLDATFGRGGHSQEILACLNENGRLLVMDKDPDAIKVAEQLAANDSRVHVAHQSFADLDAFVTDLGLEGGVDGIFMDLGVSSPQLDDAERGFSFRFDGPLDMRMDTTRGESASEWIMKAKEDDIVFVLKTYGEERFARRIAKKIIEERELKVIARTSELANIVRDAIPFKEKNKDPATRSFQAIRIYVNRELQDLDVGLEAAAKHLAAAGRLVVISFHSLEDRIVKRFMRDLSRPKEMLLKLPVREVDLSTVLTLKGKAKKAQQDEVKQNPRSRSAVLRVAEKCA